VSDLPPELRAALDRALATVPRPRLQAATARLVDAYRAPGPPPVLATADDAAAYAAYRMPATYAAVRAALRSAALRTAAPVTAAPVTAAPVTAAPDTAAPVTAAPDTAARHRARALAPGSRLDLGGGTGAAGWAAAETFPTISTVTVLDRSAAALALGRRLAAAGRPAVRGAAWRRWRLRPGTALPAADLVTACCLLGELSPAERPGLVGAMAAAGSAVLLVEPGTPDGYRRVLAARTQLLQAGWIVQAPCPHQRDCPLVGGRDWCHFAARVVRSPLHRQLKDGTRGHEDEKFCYLVATRQPAPVSAAAAPVPAVGPPPAASGRIVRHPRQRRGLVTLEVCTAEGEIRRTTVARSQGEAYRAARRAAWGDPWPPEWLESNVRPGH